MKKTSTLIVLCIFLALQPAFAHPPSSIDISYDPVTKMVTAVIEHPVENPRTHYIAEVDIAVNAKSVIRHKIRAQENAEKQVVSYRLPGVRPGDTVTVQATCSMGNVRSQVLEIG